MAEDQVDATALAALQVLPAVAIFVASFASVRFHAHRDRALARLDGIEVQIRHAVEADEDSADREVEELSREHARSIEEWPSVLDMTGINLILLGMVLLLEIAAAVHMGWALDLHIARWGVAFLSFAVIFVTQAVLVVVGIFDAKRVRGQLLEKRWASLWSRIATLVNLLTRHDLDFGAVRKLAYEVFEQAPGAPWAARLRGRVLLEIGRRQRDVEVLHDAITELSRAMDLKAEHQRSPVAELKLRSQAQAHELLGAYEYALADLTEAIEWDEHDPDLWQLSGALNVRIARLDEDRGDDEAAARRYGEARQDYERASRLDLLSVEPLLAWAELELRTKAYQRAMALVEQARQLQPESPAVSAMRQRIETARDLAR